MVGGPIGVLAGGAVVAFLGLLPAVYSNPTTLLSLFLIVPSLGGYAIRFVWGRSRLTALTSIGTAVGWVLLVAFFFSPIPPLQNLLFVFISRGPSRPSSSP